MKIAEVARILGARVLCGEDRLDDEITKAFGADMMSDVLAFMDEDTLLLTGLVNAHVIRTAEMLDLKCIVFVRGKTVSDEIIERAREENLCLMMTDKTLYHASGLLYNAGLPGCEKE
ncbi:hypothetical protein LJC27_00200 [Christensenellaceae bacterium OttesenSCG-928-M15]|nr:hypothetical protein [Christensenellaceae bacterium OttesenSCG-928-M15]